MCQGLSFGLHLWVRVLSFSSQLQSHHICYLLYYRPQLSFPDSLATQLPRMLFSNIRREEGQGNNETLALGSQPRLQQYMLRLQPVQLQEWGSWVSMDFLVAFHGNSDSSNFGNCRNSTLVASRENVVLLPFNLKGSSSFLQLLSLGYVPSAILIHLQLIDSPFVFIT